MDSSVKYQFLMSQLKPLQEIRDTEKTKLSIVFYEQTQSACLLRVCKNRDLSAVCESLRKVRNPNAAVVYDYVFYEGDTYILEENLNGKTVQEHIDMGQMFSEKETARIVVGICGALEDLHQEAPPVVHNDINPSNIMLREDGSVKLFDFDISRLYKQGAGQNTTLFGTEEYASPEHYGYGQSEPRTDIYCLGVTMHKMLTGESLSTDHRITYRGKMKPILEKCLQFDPKDRYATAQALRKDLEQFLVGKKRWLRNVVWGLVAGAVLVALAFWGYSAWKSPRREAPGPGTTAQVQDPEQPETPSQGQEPDTPNDSRKNAALRQIGQIYKECIAEDGVADWFRFVTGEGLSVYRIYVDSNGDDPINGRTTLQLYDSEGRELEKRSFDYQKAGFVDVLLQENAEYAIKVSAENTVPATGDYLLEITQRICDAGTDKTNAAPLTLATPYEAKADSTLADVYAFTVEQSGQYKIEIRNIDVGGKLSFYGKVGDGTRFSGWVNHEAIGERTFSAEAGEVIYIEIDTDDYKANGRYTVFISRP